MARRARDEFWSYNESATWRVCRDVLGHESGHRRLTYRLAMTLVLGPSPENSLKWTEKNFVLPKQDNVFKIITATDLIAADMSTRARVRTRSQFDLMVAYSRPI